MLGRLRGNKWQVGDDFAIKVEASDLSGFLNRQLVVEAGTNVVILEHGRIELGPLGPGEYNLRQMGLVGKTEATAVLVRAGLTPLEFELEGLFTQDPAEVALTCSLTVEIDEPAAFVTNVMVDRRSLSLDELEQMLLPEVRRACERFVRERSIEQLDLDLQDEAVLEGIIDVHLEQTFDDFGLAFGNVRWLDVRHAEWDTIRQERAEYFIGITKEEAVRSDRKRLADLLHERALEEIAEEGRQLQLRQQRLEVWQGVKDALLQERRIDLGHEQAVADLLREHDRHEVLAEAEVAQLAGEVQAQALEGEAARAHLLAKADLGRKHELAMREKVFRRESTEAELDYEEWVEQRKQTHTLRLERELWQAELERREAENEFEARQAERRAEIDRLRLEAERDEDRKDLLLAAEAMEMMKEKQHRERLREMEVAQQKLELELRAEERRLDMELRRDEARHGWELERLRALSELSGEALIAASDTDQARLLAELAQTKALEGFSEEQILAMAAAKSPEVAKAFQEKYRGVTAEERSELYERMLADRDSRITDQEQRHREQTQTMVDLFNKAQDTLADTAKGVAAAGASSDGPIIVTGSGEARSVGGGKGGNQVMMCPRCRVECKPGVKFCSSCGHQFYE